MNRFSRWEPALLPLVAAAGCVGLAALGPTDGDVPLCPTRALLGIDCPFCGGLRCAAALGRGDIGAAVDHNAWLIAMTPLVIVWWAMWMARRARRPDAEPPKPPAALWWAVGSAALAFTVARNTLGGRAGGFLAAAN